MAQWEYKVIKALRGTGEMEHALQSNGAFGWELVSAHWGVWMLSAYLKREKISDTRQASAETGLYGSKRL